MEENWEAVKFPQNAETKSKNLHFARLFWIYNVQWNKDKYQISFNTLLEKFYCQIAFEANYKRLQFFFSSASLDKAISNSDYYDLRLVYLIIKFFSNNHIFWKDFDDLCEFCHIQIYYKDDHKVTLSKALKVVASMHLPIKQKLNSGVVKKTPDHQNRCVKICGTICLNVI